MQFLRAFAAIVVILRHTSIHGELGAIGVDIFFAISGFVMILSTTRLREKANAAAIFLRRRAVRIVPIYWLFTALAIIVLALRHQLPPAPSIIASLLFIPYRGPAAPAPIYYPILAIGWSLAYEVFFYLSFALCLALHKSPFLLAPFFILLTFIGIYHPTPSIGIVSLFNYRLLEFIAGMAIAVLYLRRTLLPRLYAAPLALSAIAAVVIFHHDTLFTHATIWAPASLLFVYALLSFESIFAALTPGLITLLADASYVIYLCHQQFGIEFMQTLDHHSSHFHNLVFTHHAVWPIFGIVLSCTVGILIHIFIERRLLSYFSVRIGGHAPSPPLVPSL